MFKIIRKTLVLGSWLLVLAYFSACAYLYFGQEGLLFHPPKTPADKIYTDFPGPFEEVWIPVEGAKLHILHFYAKNPRGVVIFFHGNTQNAEDYGKTANEFTDQGLDYLIPDYRGFGKSTGKIETEKQFLRDTEIFYEWVKTKYPEDKIYLGGRSLGCVPAAYLGSKNKPKRIILISPFFNIAAMADIRYPFMPKFLVRYKFRNDAWIAQAQSPVYLIHGDQDKTIPPSHSERLADLAKVPHRYFSVPGAAHGDLQKFPLYHKILWHLMNREPED